MCTPVVAHLHVLYLPHVDVLAVEQQTADLLHLGLDLHGLVVHDRELGLQTLVLRGLHDHGLRQRRQLGEGRRGYTTKYCIIIVKDNSFKKV